MDWEVKKNGRVTYYRRKTNHVFSDLVVEELDNGDLKIRFVGMTGADAATQMLGLSDMAEMQPLKEIPRLFDVWDMYVREAGICEGLQDLDFLELHSFGAAPRQPNPFVDPEGYHKERERIRSEYNKAYADYWKEKMPDRGLPTRFTVYLSDLPDKWASYEMCAVALLQKDRKE